MPDINPAITDTVVPQAQPTRRARRMSGLRKTSAGISVMLHYLATGPLHDTAGPPAGWLAWSR